MKGITLLLLVSSLLLAVVSAQEWQVAYPNVMTIAIGVSAPDANTVYVSGAADGKSRTTPLSPSHNLLFPFLGNIFFFF